MDTTLTSTPGTNRRRHGRMRAGLVVVALGATAVLAGCGADGGQEAGTTEVSAIEDTSTTVAPDSTSKPATESTPVTEAPGGDQVGGDQGSGGQVDQGGSGGGSQGTNPGGGTTPVTQPASPKPVIVSVTHPENIDCHNGNLQNFTFGWETTDTTKVTISIDGPGIFDTYGPTGEATLPFNCSTPHTFLVTAYGQGGQTATRSVTLQPRNAQAPGSDEDPPSDS